MLAQPSKAAAVELRLDPATTLPGLPVAFLVSLPTEVVERGLNQVSAVLHVASSDTGEAFEAHFDSDSNVTGWIDLDMRSLPSHGIVEVQQPIDPPYGPDWFADERLHKPGIYRLQLQILVKDLGMPEDLWSSQATLVVREPQGVDSEAWAWLRTQGAGEWKREKWSKDLGAALAQTFPSSAYARFGIGMLTRLPQGREPWLRKAIELSEGTPLGDFYRLRLEGRQSAYLCEEPSFGASRSARAERRTCILRVTHDASAKIRSIAANTSSPSVRQLADVMLRRLQQEADDIRTLKE